MNDFINITIGLDPFLFSQTQASMTTNKEVCHYCSSMKTLAGSYRRPHGYLSIVVCIFGIISNVLNVAVLSQPQMIILPINRILRWLAVTDIILMLEYIPFSVFYLLQLWPDSVYSYEGAAYTLFHVYVSHFLHTISIFMTLTLAIWRYANIKQPCRMVNNPTDEKFRRCIALAFALPALICAPSYLIFGIRRIKKDTYVVNFTELASQNGDLLFYLYLWIYAVLVKLVPCLIMTLITCWLVKTMKLASERSMMLASNKYLPPNRSSTGYDTGDHLIPASAKITVNEDHLEPGHLSKKRRKIDRTTNILVAVLSLFIITEFPQGILGLLSAILGKCFFVKCYAAMGDLMDISALINGSINFILYCTMSKQFRKIFGQLFKPKILQNLQHTSHLEMDVLTTTNMNL